MVSSSHARLLCAQLASQLFHDDDEDPAPLAHPFDVRLICGGQTCVWAHACVLAAVSPWLKDMLTDIRARQPEDVVTLILPGADAREVCWLRRLLYTGQATLKEKETAVAVTQLRTLCWTLCITSMPVTEELCCEDKAPPSADPSRLKRESRPAKTFTCPDCGRPYRTDSSLRRHRRLCPAHSPGRRHLCDICGRVSSTRDLAATHRRTHGPRLLHCPVCRRAFKTRSVLYQHRLTHRDAGERFACPRDACAKRFRTKQNLQMHLRTHTGEAPHACPVCQVRFKRAHHLKQHLQTLAHRERAAERSTEGEPELVATVAEVKTDVVVGQVQATVFDGGGEDVLCTIILSDSA